MTRGKNPEAGPAAPHPGVTRRDFIRKAGIVAGTVAWVAPAIQTLAPPASAHFSPGIQTCCQCQGPALQTMCFANDPNADTVAECDALCTAQGMGWGFGEFHRDFPSGSGGMFGCVNDQCSPDPH